MLRSLAASQVGLVLIVVVAMLVPGRAARADVDSRHTPVTSDRLPPGFTPPPIAETGGGSSDRSGHRIFFVFKKNHQDPTDSRLTLWRVTTRKNEAPRYQEIRSWRAGSGMGRAPSGTDACAKNKGWLPNGWYDAHHDGPAFDTDYVGTLIFGIVWRLEDKACGPGNTGVVRNDLFIHSEMTSERKQRCDRPDDYQENQCWDDDSDYLSAGCIKLKYKDIKKAAKLAKSKGGPRTGQKEYAHLLFVTD